MSIVKGRGVVSFMLLGLLAAARLGAAPREKEWEAVREATTKGLPRTAIEHLNTIAAAATAGQAYAEAVRAIAQRIALEGLVEGNRAEERVTRMEQAIGAAPEPMRPIMQAILANWYWSYFQQNRWRFMQRTRTGEGVGDDLTTWDLPRILTEIRRRFGAALAAAPELKRIPVSDYDALLEKGNVGDDLRPTLYDIVAHLAIEFYGSDLQAGAQAEDAFVIDAASPIFDDVDSFLAWRPTVTDEASLTAAAIRLFQDLLAFHKPDADRSAFLDADLLRLRFGHDHAAGEVAGERYRQALERFSQRHAGHPAFAAAAAAWAATLVEDDPAKAHDIAKRGKTAFPESPGGRLCHDLLATIEQRDFRITVERVWSDPRPTIDITYRNITSLHIRVVAHDFNDLMRRKDSWREPHYLDDAEQRRLLAARPTLSWSVPLPATKDYAEHTERIAVPNTLAPGYYFIFASHRPDFSYEHNQLAYAAFWESNLALIVRSRGGSDAVEGFVLESRSGAPVVGASVGGWTRPRDKREAITPVKTDTNGFFRTGPLPERAYLLLARHGEQAVATFGDGWVSRHVESWPRKQTVFFTDRSLYRPGQIVRYKGICLSSHQPKAEYETLAGEQVTVIFSDPNGKEIARRSHKTSERGSFDGSFTAPRDRVTGLMRIATDGAPRGQAHVRVEEYKRPKFQVTVAPAEAGGRLGGGVTVRGEAKAYTGAPVDGAKVTYRVMREVRFPPWWMWCGWWGGWNPHQGSQEITHGTAVTDDQGRFVVRFEARPDPTVDPKSEPTFFFTVSADVTDAAGETRSGERHVHLGFADVQAALTANEWQTTERPVVLTARTLSLDGEARQAKGVVRIHSLVMPKAVVRPALSPPHWMYGRARRGGPAAGKDPSDPNSWELGKVVAEKPFHTGTNGEARVEARLKHGLYRAVLETRDSAGKPVTALLPLTVIDPGAKRFDPPVPNHVAAEAWLLEPGMAFRGVWATGYESGRAFVEIEQGGRLLRCFWTPSETMQSLITQPIDTTMRGGLTLRITYVRENRLHATSRTIHVPWTNQRLELGWTRFVSKLGPGREETWTATVKGTNAGPVAAEWVAGLYDASLDAYYPHRWPSAIGDFRQEHDPCSPQFVNALAPLTITRRSWPTDHRGYTIVYRHLPAELLVRGRHDYHLRRRGLAIGGAVDGLAMAAADGLMFDAATAPPGVAAPAAAMPEESGARKELVYHGDSDKGVGAARAAGPDLSAIVARKNLAETAFFYPQLQSGTDGVVRVTFTMPEALTEWRFQAFAHDRKLRSGYLEATAVTSKDLMIEPNAPRFVREGDMLEFTVKVSNRSAGRLKGRIALSFTDAATLAAADATVGNSDSEKPFDVAAGASTALSWRITIPDGTGFLSYKAVGAAGDLSDGEEGWLPVLSRRILVTESLPLPIRGPQTKTFTFDHLKRSSESDTLQHQSLTLQMVSQPAWYAVLALPYLMEYPYECSEQIFNRLYANALAQHIATGNPRIRQIFDQWRNTPALDSPLQKNEELKAVRLEETPWYRQAQKESQARRDVGILFDANRLKDELGRAQSKLAEQQYDNGLWPWFPGGRPNTYITLYIATGYGRLRHLNAAVEVAPALKALAGLDAWLDDLYRKILQSGHKEENHLTPEVALYLYGRSFFLKDRPVKGGAAEALAYFRQQARTYWLDLGNRQSQAHVALGMHRLGDAEVARAVMDSLRERAVSSEEMGMFWRDTELSWWWFRAPIETQALMIEAFDEVAQDAEAAEACKVWLLKQKQTQDWKTTKATADAVYGLLRRGRDLLSSDALVEVTLGDKLIKPGAVEPGTGFYETRFTPAEISPAMAKVTVRKTDEGVAWGSLHWQYLEDMAKVEPYEGTPLRLRKTLFVRENSRQGPTLRPLKGSLAVGDELVVRIELRTDRDMEYVHLKDGRGSGTEPTDVLSHYRFQDGLAYYASTRDTASHFFIDYLPKGTYVFEYVTRVVHRGRYQTGVADVQCMYAPEFNSHSESMLLEVK